MNKLMSLITVEEGEVEAIRELIASRIGMKPHAKSAYLIAAITRILEEHKQYGKLTVRQVYYQLVTKRVIENSKKSYQSYDTHLTTGRKAGVIPWDAFEDRARIFHKEPFPRYDILTERSEEEALKSWFEYALNPKVSTEYDISKWEGQDHKVEVWVEKDALAGFLSPLCESLGVGLVVSRGYTSYTFKQEAIKRFNETLKQSRLPVLLYLGDLDPSGYDIFRCLKEEIGDMEGVANVLRIGLDPEDINQFGLVPNKVKKKDGKKEDSRTKGFRKLFPQLGEDVYELDGLPPGELIDRARKNILHYFDEDRHEQNERRVRHWRTNFTDHQKTIKKILKKAGIKLN
jgi:hypothetical protein